MEQQRQPDRLDHEGERHTHRFNPEDHDLLDDKDRLESFRAKELAERIGSYEPTRFLDFGTGTGLFIPPIVEELPPDAEVIALDLEEELLERVNQRSKEEGIDDRVMVKQGEPDAVPLPEDSIDLTLIVMTLHELANPKAILEDLSRVTKPDGRVVVIDWQEDNDPDEGPPPDHRVGIPEAKTWFAEVSFTDTESEEWTDTLYYLEARK